MTYVSIGRPDGIALKLSGTAQHDYLSFKS